MRNIRKRLFSVLCIMALILTVIPFHSEAADHTAALTEVEDMTVAYLTDPVGIDVDQVRFGWKLKSNQIGTEQESYQIQVTDTDGKEVWDSGKVTSGQAVGVEYSGSVLQEGTAYEWTVTVWTKDGAKIVSDAAAFETGVTNDPSWKKASFICMNQSTAAPVFRTEQKLSGTVQSARLYITAIGAYQAYLNGRQVGVPEEGKMTYHHMNPGYGNRNISMGYQTYDVTEMLAGESCAAVSILAGNGWNNGTAGSSIGVSSAQPAVKAMLRIVYEDHTVQEILTNTSDWKGTLDGGITANGVYFGENYDARSAEALGDFTQAGYDDSEWVSAPAEGPKFPVIEQELNVASKVKYIRLRVEETGPGTKNDQENRLQMMEIEVFDGQGTNVVRGIVPAVSDEFVWGDQWKVSNLTDGNYGREDDAGYSSQMLASGQDSFRPDDPIEIKFELPEAVSPKQIRIYPRVKGEPIRGTECVNYPKACKVEVSENGSVWKEAAGITVEKLTNTILYPQTDVQAVCRTNSFETVTAQDIRLVVSQTGPAGANDNENRLQIMELELLDPQGVNVVGKMMPVTSQSFEYGTQWRKENLTDGDHGVESDAGYTTDILSYGQEELTLADPVTIAFHFEQPVSVNQLKIYARTKLESIAYNICPNYAKVYSLQISQDGGDTWKTVPGVDSYDAGLIKNEILAGKAAMSEKAYPGEIRAQAAIPGKINDSYSKTPVSAVLYQGTKDSQALPGGEIAVDTYYAYEEPADELYRDHYQKVEDGQSFFGKGIPLKKGQTMILNMGQNLTAVPEVEFEAKRGTRLTMRFAEMLNDGSAVGDGATQADGPKGSIYQKSLRNARSAVQYTFAGTGKEHYQTAMSFFGYQYVELTATDDVTIYQLRSRALSSVTDQTGTIETNNKQVNQLFSNTLYGQMSNYFTTSTDCPQRDERLAWSGDFQAFAQTAVYNFDSVAFIRELQDILSENTMIKGYVPAVFDDLTGYFSTWATGWSDVLIVNPWVLYNQTGDVSVLRDNWTAMVRYMDFMKEHERGENQAPIDLGGDRNFGDWLSFQGTSVEVISDYYYGYMASLMAKIAGILGDMEKQATYEQQFAAIKKTFLQTHVTFENGDLVIHSKDGDMQKYQFMWWAGKGGVWEDNSQTALLWMLKLGFYDSAEMKEAAERLLIENIRNENPAAGSIRANYGENTLAVGFLGSNVITPVLSDHGYSDVAYDLLLQDEQPSWLFEVKAGATTIWERWNSYTPGVGFGDSEMNSFNHYAYGSVVEWMYRYMAGITADEEEPGFKHIILQPTPDTGTKYNEEDRINDVKASYESYYGTIRSEWKSEAGEIASYRTEIPANTDATLYLPVTEKVMKEFAPVEGVQFAGMELHNGMQTAKIHLASGGYEFSLKDGVLTVAYADGYGEEGQQPDPVKPPFTDIAEDDWFYREVSYVYEHGLMRGKDETHFAPYETLVRAQFAVVLHRIEGEPEAAGGIGFPDVQDGQWYTDAILWAAGKEVGIITGYTDSGLFGTNDPITREQMAVMMYRYSDFKNYETGGATSFENYTDAESVSEFAQQAMKWAVGNKIITGKDNATRLDPQGSTSRAECAIIIQRFHERFNK